MVVKNGRQGFIGFQVYFESSECGFKSWLRPSCLCPWARHLIIIASLHPGVNGYMWGHSWLLCLMSPRYAPKWQQLSCILPRELRWFQEWFIRLMSSGNNNVQRIDLVARICALYKNHVLLLLFLSSSSFSLFVFIDCDLIFGCAIKLLYWILTISSQTISCSSMDWDFASWDKPKEGNHSIRAQLPLGYYWAVINNGAVLV